MSGLTTTQAEDLKEMVFAPWVKDLGFRVEQADGTTATLRMPFSDKLARVGGTVCGQALMALADTAMVFLISGAYGEFRPMTTVSQTTNFMRPISGSDVVAEAKLLRLGKTMAFGEVFLRADGDAAPAVHVASTYAIIQPR